MPFVSLRTKSTTSSIFCLSNFSIVQKIEKQLRLYLCNTKQRLFVTSICYLFAISVGRKARSFAMEGSPPLSGMRLKTVNSPSSFMNSESVTKKSLFRSFHSGADIVFSRICFGSTMSRIRRLHSQRISLFIPKRGRWNCLRGFAFRGLRLLQR